ncbi:MAG: DUF4935 domain-containing protein [Proteobacteria bacterium]|nr:DUF4935 domain-containing protein [Pseudomonadota bacterium]MBS0598846.1 DUF4935 domain-containing protein [Pseudomonadota bacterium]
MTLPDDRVQQLVEQGQPVLCLDTCSLLDLLRDPTREKTYATDLEHAMGLLERIESGVLAGVVAEQVQIEFHRHVDTVAAEARERMSQLLDTIDRVEAIAVLYGAAGSLDCAHWRDHPQRARALAERWLAARTPAASSPAIVGRAWARVSHGRTPATQSKNSMEDCVVIETYLDAAVQLRAAGLTHPIVFASSNIRDYTDRAQGSALRADLAAEFDALGMHYAVNYGAARHWLGV